MQLRPNDKITINHMANDDGGIASEVRREEKVVMVEEGNATRKQPVQFYLILQNRTDIGPAQFSWKQVIKGR
jgi:hypothetical protein